jgi:hypothetical protein
MATMIASKHLVWLAAGFGEVLQQIGQHFNLDGLVCYYMTFIAFLYVVNKKVFNMSLSLI